MAWSESPSERLLSFILPLLLLYSRCTLTTFWKPQSILGRNLHEVKYKIVIADVRDVISHSHYFSLSFSSALLHFQLQCRVRMILKALSINSRWHRPGFWIIYFVINVASELTRNSRFRYITIPVPLHQNNVLIPILVLTRKVCDVSRLSKRRSRLKEIMSIGALSKCVKNAKFR